MKRNSRVVATGLGLTLLATSLWGCAGTARVAGPIAQPAPEQKPAVNEEKVEKATLLTTAAEGAKGTAEAAKTEAAVDFKATVLEVAQGGGYTFLRVLNAGKEKWAAIPKDESVATGQQVEFLPGEVMTNFTSKTLGRTFDRILFSEGLVQKKQ